MVTEFFLSRLWFFDIFNFLCLWNLFAGRYKRLCVGYWYSMVDSAFNGLGNDLSKHDVDGNRASYYAKENEQKKWVLSFVLLRYPKIIGLKSMISGLSNAVSHVFIRFLSVSVQSCKVWDLYVICNGKVIFSKIHQIRLKNQVFPEGVHSGLEKLWKRLIRL